MTNVFISGAPRSGTTVLASIFSRLGWDAGERVRQSDNRMEDPLFQRANNQAFYSNDIASWWAQYPIGFSFAKELVREVLLDKKPPWLLKEPMMLMNWPHIRKDFDARLVVTVRKPSQNIPAIMAFTGFPHLRVMRLLWRQMILAYMWSELFGDVHFVAFPQMWGLKKAVTDLGGSFDGRAIQECFSLDSVSGYEDLHDPTFEALYQKLLDKTGRTIGH